MRSVSIITSQPNIVSSAHKIVTKETNFKYEIQNMSSFQRQHRSKIKSKLKPNLHLIIDTHLCALQSGNIFTLFIIHQERYLLVNILTLLHRNHLTYRLLIALKLQMTDNVRNLLTFLIRKFSLDLDRYLAT